MEKKMNEVLKKMSECAVKIACNTASLNLCGQPKEPENLKNILIKEKESKLFFAGGINYDCIIKNYIGFLLSK